MKGIILHGGHGTRLRPLTHTGPKQLLPIANKPMSEYCVEAIRDCGITDIAIIIGGIGSKKVKEYYGDGSKFNLKISYIKQDEPKGIAHAINLCKNFVGNEKFIVFLGDNIIQKSISDISKSAFRPKFFFWAIIFNPFSTIALLGPINGTTSQMVPNATKSNTLETLGALDFDIYPSEIN